MLSYVTVWFAVNIIGEVCSKNIPRVTEFKVPPEAFLGETVKLSCIYDLGSEELYVVKWYKDDLEFYRYEPKDRNQSVYFPQPGIDLDLSQSGSEVVYLRNIEFDSAGSYKCQVSTDAPRYGCVQAVKNMNVVVLPSHGPTVNGGEGNYEVGDNVTLNCTAAKSRPAADLRWIVNGKPINEDMPNFTDMTDSGVTVYHDYLESSFTTLRLPVTKKLLSKGKLAIKCESHLLGRMAFLSKDITVIEIYGASTCTFQYSILLILIFITLWPGFR